jgi:histidine triad (HIT) family protein
MSRCIFCELAAPGHADPELTVFENDHVFAHISLSQKRGNHGHVLVITKAHIPNIYELPNELDASLMSALSLISKAVKKAFTADGVHIRQNNEPAAGQDVFHLHFHVIPRYYADRFESQNMKIWI